MRTALPTVAPTNMPTSAPTAAMPTSLPRCSGLVNGGFEDIEESGCQEHLDNDSSKECVLLGYSDGHFPDPRGWNFNLYTSGSHKLMRTGNTWLPDVKAIEGTNWFSFNGGGQYITQNVTVTPDTQYTLKFKAASNHRQQNWTATLGVIVEYVNKTWEYKLWETGIPADNKWHDYTLDLGKFDSDSFALNFESCSNHPQCQDARGTPML